MQTLAEILPAVNAALNIVCAAFLVAGRRAALRHDAERHRKLMIGALITAAVFLACYLTRTALTGTHRFEGPATLRAIYLVILVSHMILAALVLPMVLRAVWLAVNDRIDEHRRLVRWLWPTWMYVSVTGVAVYVMLYHVGRAVS